MPVKDLSHEKNNSVNPLYLIIDKINEESNDAKQRRNDKA